MTSILIACPNRYFFRIACGILTSGICLASESPTAIFLDPTQRVEARLKAIQSIEPRELKASAEQLITIFGDTKLPDPIRGFAVSGIQFSPITLRPEHQTQIDNIATSIVQNNQDGGNDLKLSILQWIYTRGTFGQLKGIPTVPPAALRNLLTSDVPEIRKKAIRFIREDDLSFAKELEECLQGNPLGKVTTLEALTGLSRRNDTPRKSPSYQHPPFNKEVLVPLLKHESYEVAKLAAQQLARSDEREYFHEKIRSVLTHPDTHEALKISMMDALTRSFVPVNDLLHDYAISLSQIIQDAKSTPELKRNAFINLYLLIKEHPPGSVREVVTEPLYTLHLDYLKKDPEGILFEVVNREAVPKWADHLEPIYDELVKKYPSYMAKREARRLLAEQNKLKKEIGILHDKSQAPLVRHQMLTNVGRLTDEAARFATDPANDEKMRVMAIERLLRDLSNKQEEIDPDLVRFAKVIKQVSEEKSESAAKSRAIQFKDIIRKNHPATFSKIFENDK